MGVVFRQAWNESQWTVLMGYLAISINIWHYQTHHRWQFFSFRNTVHWRTLCANALSFWKKKNVICDVRTLHATQSNCCGALDFLSNEPCSPTVPSWTHWLQDLGSHTAAWIWVASQKDWRNQGATGWILATHWYSIWMKQCDFRVSPFCQVLQKHTLFEVAH